MFLFCLCVILRQLKKIFLIRFGSAPDPRRCQLKSFDKIMPACRILATCFQAGIFKTLQGIFSLCRALH